MPKRTNLLSLDALRLQRLTLYRYRRGLLFDICLAARMDDQATLATLGYKWHKISNAIKVLNRWIKELDHVL